MTELTLPFNPQTLPKFAPKSTASATWYSLALHTSNKIIIRAGRFDFERSSNTDRLQFVGLSVPPDERRDKWCRRDKQGRKCDNILQRDVECVAHPTGNKRQQRLCYSIRDHDVLGDRHVNCAVLSQNLLQNLDSASTDHGGKEDINA